MPGVLPAGWPWVGVAAVFVLLGVFGFSGRVIGSWVLKFILGGAALVALDVVGRNVAVLHLGVNPLTAATVGYLGVPGLLLVVGTHAILAGGL